MTTSKRNIITSNRQINTGFNKSQDETMDLEVTRAGIFKGKETKVGDVISVSKSEAKRILVIHKGLFKIKID